MTKPTNRKPSSKRAETSAGRASAPARANGNMAEASPKDAARKKATRSEDLRIKVAGGLKQRFKRAAKSAGVKKGVLLERLLTEWEERQPGVVTAPTPGPDNAESGLRASAAAPGRQAKRPPRGA